MSDPFRALAGIAEDLGAHRARAEAAALAERVAEGRCYVACVGQFKRGKSTLLNALVGRSVLPTGVLPVTAAPTILRYGEEAAALVRRTDGTAEAVAPDALSDYVTEERNPGNVRGVDAVEILLPSPLLRGGLCLVDTPGLGSVFEIATESTRAFLPRIDAALLVLGADPPISADEADLAATVTDRVAEVIVVLAKADRVSAADREEAGRFAARVLEERTGRPPGPILQVSSIECMTGQATRDWDRLVERLHALSTTAGHARLQATRERAAGRLATRLLALAAEQRGLLAASAAERERRLEALHRASSALEERLRHLGRILLAEEEGLGEVLRERRDTFVERTWPRVLEELDSALATARSARGPAYRRLAAESAREIGRRGIEPWLAAEQDAAELLFHETAGRLVDAANRFVDELAASGEAGLPPLPHLAAPADAALGSSRFRFNRFETHFVSPGPLQWLLDTLAPPRWLRRRIRGRAEEFLRWLLEANAARVRNDLLERLGESRKGLEREIRGILEEARAWAEAATHRASTLHAAGAEAARQERARLDAIERALGELDPRPDAPA